LPSGPATGEGHSAVRDQQAMSEEADSNTIGEGRGLKQAGEGSIPCIVEANKVDQVQAECTQIGDMVLRRDEAAAGQTH
jgi:hypothetical protein